jgi:predicted anti-sigma-YlaC factor YlaD
MTCTLFEDFYEGKLDETTDWNWEYIVGEHLDTCPECKKYYETHVKNKKVTLK